MPAGSRVRANNVFGTVVDNPLAAGATTLTSVELALLPAITASEHAVLTLDPLRQHGEPEIVIVTAHASGAQTATITRGAYNTIDRNHPQTTVWVHAPVTEDVVVITTSGNRPADPYDGQLIFEEDTERFMFSLGPSWFGIIPAGVVAEFAGIAAPSGWLLCDGQAVSRTAFADLFSTIGTAYGAGDGSTTFNVPDFRGRTPVGVSPGDPDFGVRGQLSGAKTHTLTTAQIPSHNHTQNSHNHTQNSHNHTQSAHSHIYRVRGTADVNHQHTAGSVKAAGVPIPEAGGGDGTPPTDTTTAGNIAATATNQAATATNNATGGGAAHNNIQPSLAVPFIIKY